MASPRRSPASADPIDAALGALAEQWPRCRALLIGFSGGLDSTVLLDAARQLQRPLRALHIDHGLHPLSGRWHAHCAAHCAARGVEFVAQSLRWPAPAVAITDLEAAARAARYRVFSAQLRRGELLLLAHHADDQLETLLYRLLRGGGAGGLAAMPAQRALGRGHLWRPLLAVPRAALLARARARGLDWIDDPGNADQRFDRNYLRAQVVPPLRARWPAAARSAARAAAQLGETQALLERLLAPHLAALMALPASGGRCPQWSLALGGLRERAGDERRALLRLWLRENGLLRFSQRTLVAIERDCLFARADADPVIGVEGGSLRRHRDRLYLVPPPPPPPPPFDWWPGRAVVEVGALLLDAATPFGRRLRRPVAAPYRVRFRAGGERIATRGGTRALKKILQEAGVPSWERAVLPLLFDGERLAAVWPIAIDPKYEIVN